MSPSNINTNNINYITLHELNSSDRNIKKNAVIYWMDSKKSREITIIKNCLLL